MVSFYVYILRCSDGSYYTGHTDNLEERLARHRLGNDLCYTSNRRPIELIYSQDFVTRYEAVSAERKIKGWSRNKKDALIKGDWQRLSELSKSYSNK